MKGTDSTGRRFRALRAFEGLTQKQVAQKAGVTQPIISLIERGLFAPKGDLRKSISSVLGRKPEELFPDN